MSDIDEQHKMESEVEELRIQNKVLSREIITMSFGHDKVINALLRCQGLLAQFMSPVVRSDFVSGALNVPDNSQDVLLSLDVFRSIMLPYPGVSKGRFEFDGGALVFISKLLSRDDSEPVSERGSTLPRRQSFDSWRVYFNTLHSSTYWKAQEHKLSDFATAPIVAVGGKGKPFDTREGEFSSRELPVKGSNSGFRGGSFDVGVNDGKICRSFEGTMSGSRPCNAGNRDSRQRSDSPGVRGGRKLISGRGKNKIQYGTADEDDFSDYDKTCDSSSSSSDNSRGYTSQVRRKAKTRHADDLTQVLRNLKLPREAVPPVRFDLRSGVSLKRFLEQYERYFDTKYEGTERDKSQLLERFLQGSVKDAYDAIGGSQLKYAKLKPKMLDWYDTERVGARQRKFNEFQSCQMRSSDSLTVYAMRLESTALKAFPDSLSERDRQLRSKFRQTVPSTFIRMMETSQSSLAMLGEKKMSWTMIKRLAESHDRQIKERQESHMRLLSSDEDNKAKDVWYSRPSAPFDHNSYTDRNTPTPRSDVGKRRQQFQPPGARPRTFTRTSGCQGNKSDFPRGKSAFGGRLSSVPNCRWCGRIGHIEESCWTKLGLCMACGSKSHDRSACDRFPISPQPQILECSLCGGEHLGRDCPENAVSQGNA